MNIPKEKLSLIGISIKVNRKARLKETKSGRWNQQNFSDGICSQNTLIKIERGQVSRFIEVYAEAAERLGLRLGYFPEVDKLIDKIAPKLYKAVEFYDLKKIMLYTKKLIEILEPYKLCLWYCDLYLFSNSFTAYYQNEKYIEIKKLDTYIDMINEFNDTISEILKHLIFTSVYMELNRQNTNESELRKIYKQIEIDKSTFAANVLNKMIYCFIFEKTTALLMMLNDIETRYMETQNFIRLLDGYSLVISYLSVMGKEEVDEYIEKYEKLLMRVSLSQIKIKEYYYGLGTALYELGRYEKAISCFEKSYENDINITNPSFIYIASAQRKMGVSINIPFYMEKDIQKFPIDIKQLYNYYKLNDDIPAFIKQKFIMERILPNLRPKDELLVNILREELIGLIQETNHYKDSIIFEIKCRELLS